MRSAYDSYYSSSSLRNSSSVSPLRSLDTSLTPVSGSERAEFHDRYQNKVKFFLTKKSLLLINRYSFQYAWLEKNHVNEVGSTYNSLGKRVDHKPSAWRCEDQAETGK